MKKALLIGVNDYPKPCRLRGCLEDIKQVRDAIERNGDGSKNFDVMMLSDIRAGVEAMAYIEELFKGDSETALLYFSGHGYANLTDAELVFPEDVGAYYKGIKMSDILAVASHSNVRNKVIVLDCCHSGQMGKFHISDNEAAIASGVSILTACRADESAMECGGHGLFTEQFCNALRGGAADFCGNITIGGIYTYIDRSFGQWEQRPTFKTNVTEFAPLKNVEPKVSESIIRQLTSLFVAPDVELALDPSFEYTNSLEFEHRLVEPYATEENVGRFKVLQKLQSIGFVEPVEEEFMYWAAMHSKSCRLTSLGQYYWRLVNDGRI